MQVDITNKYLITEERRAIQNLLHRQLIGLNDLEQMWYLMDLIWDDLGCNNKRLDWNKIGAFYQHPVWILNGLFIEQHRESMSHRHAISDWIVKNEFTSVVDYGGGFGTLARLIATKNKNINVCIYEPYPSQFGIKRADEFKNIVIKKIIEGEYDCLIATDVLEHVPDPCKNLEDMVKNVKIGGYLVIANCFFPVIKCHLPQVFHLRYSFNLIAKIMGLEVKGPLEGSHATIFKKVTEKEATWFWVRSCEMLSRILFPIVETLKPLLKFIKRFIQ